MQNPGLIFYFIPIHTIMMRSVIRNLAPKKLWNHFSDLNAVPRPSKKEGRVIQFMVDFGTRLHLETLVLTR